MLKAERDNAITRLGAQDRLVFRRVVDAMKEARAFSPNGQTDSGQVAARRVMENWDEPLSGDVKLAVEAVVARDEKGPRVGEVAPGFDLKRLGSDERVRLSDFRGRRPVALAFGSYT